MEEKWKPIPGYPGYSASSLGRVKSEFRTVLMPHTSPRRQHERILAQSVAGSDKRLTVQLSRDGIAKRYYVARLVLMAFVGMPAEKQEASHLNDDRLDNRLENLVWESRKENEARKVGSRVTSAKISQQQAQEIRTRYAAGGIRQKDLGAEYGIGQAQVWRIITGQRWKESKHAS